MFKNSKISLEKQQVRILWHKEYGRKWLLKLQHQSHNTEAILSKNQIKSSAQGQKLLTRQMEKLKSLSKRMSHAPAAEDWDAGTHFPSLEIINPFPVPDFPQNSNSRLLVPAEHTDRAVLRAAEVPAKPDQYKREPGTCQAPKEQVPSTGTQGRRTAPVAQ